MLCMEGLVLARSFFYLGIVYIHVRMHILLIHDVR